MRAFPVIAAAFVIFWAIVLVVLGRQAAETDQPDAGCREEAIRLKIAMSGPIGTIRRAGADIVIEVDRRFWLRMHRNQQIDIALAAWCGVALERKGGMVRIVTAFGEDELGRVVNGRWSSKYGG